MMMQDYKHMHRSNWPTRPSKWRRAAEAMAGGLFMTAMFFGLFWIALDEYMRLYP